MRKVLESVANVVDHQDFEFLWGKPQWGPIGQEVYERTYSRKKPDGTNEEWKDTVRRVVDGNCSFVSPRYIEEGEREALYELFYNFKAIPAGRHLWACGVPGRNYLYNCHLSSWSDRLSDHFAFTFNELMKGGGTGTNYSNKLIDRYTEVIRPVHVHIVCNEAHKDYDYMREKGWISTKYSAEWDGAIRVRDSRGGWVDALRDVIDYAMGDRDPQEEVREFVNGDIVVDVSLVRPMGSPIRGFGGVASGPWALAKMLIQVGKILFEHTGKFLNSLTLMDMDHEIASCVVAGNIRRSARMSMKHWEDPDIEKFITCKVGNVSHWTTNISVIIDSKFLRQMKRKNTKASRLLTKCVASMVLRGEPGFWNYTLSQSGEPNEVEATNPCGEQNLIPWDGCNLGHINLEKFVGESGNDIFKAFRLMTRFLIRATFCDIEDPKQQKAIRDNRRIGVGFFGFHGWLVKQGIKFSECHDSHFGVGARLKQFKSCVYKAAREYAFDLRIPEPVKKTTLAPTGSIAKLSGNSEGGQSIFDLFYERTMRVAASDPKLPSFLERGLKIVKDPDSANTHIVSFICKDRLVEDLENLGMDYEELLEGASDISVEDHFAVQAMIQRDYVDNAIAYTANMLAPDCVETIKKDGRYFLRVVKGCEKDFDKVVEDLTSVFKRKLPQLKGTTLVAEGAYDNPPYKRLSKEEYETLSAKYGSEVSMAIQDCKNGCPIK